MTAEPLVSIVTPCFDGATHVARFLESVLNQTETDAELIFVDDGSTDGTEDVVMSYRRDLESTLRRFRYVHQPNGGLGSAINAGLKHVEGRYLVWPDSDDYLEPTSLAERAAVLGRSSEFAVVTSDAYVRDAAQLNVIGRVSDGTPHNDDPLQFEHLLRGESIFTSGTHMARMDAFVATHPGRQIFPARRGQNWQMLLPLFYRYRRFYLDRPLYNYVVYPHSMSRGDDTFEKRLLRVNDYREILLATLRTIEMPAPERARFERLVTQLHLRLLLRTGVDFNQASLAQDAYRQLRINRWSTFRDGVDYASSRSRAGRVAYDRARAIIREYSARIAGTSSPEDL